MIGLAEKNARLLINLKDKFGARDIGSISHFFEVCPEWRCPCCYRSKDEFARLDKNKNLLCQIVQHHDHFSEVLWNRVAWKDLGEWSLKAAVDASLVRFPETMICGDCNVAEPAAKSMIKAVSEFSFAPFEIASFVVVKSNIPHGLDAEKVRTAYEAAKQSMTVISGRIKAIIKNSEHETTFENVGDASNRVIELLRTKFIRKEVG
jgi:hypothetical protein